MSCGIKLRNAGCFPEAGISYRLLLGAVESAGECEIPALYAARPQLETGPAMAFAQRRLMPGPGSAARCQPVTLSMNVVRFAISRPACSSTVSCSAGRPPSPRTGFFPRTYKEQARSVHR